LAEYAIIVSKRGIGPTIVLRRAQAMENPTLELEKEISRRNMTTAGRQVTELPTVGRRRRTTARGQSGTQAISLMERWEPPHKTREAW
jgi:hypothetical protein